MNESIKIVPRFSIGDRVHYTDDLNTVGTVRNVKCNPLSLKSETFHISYDVEWDSGETDEFIASQLVKTISDYVDSV